MGPPGDSRFAIRSKAAAGCPDQLSQREADHLTQTDNDSWVDPADQGQHNVSGEVEKDSPKVQSWNLVVDLVKAAFPSANAASSPPREKRVDFASLFQSEVTEPNRLPWHPSFVTAFDSCMAEVDRPSSTSMEKESGHLPQGSFLKPSISVPTRYFKPQGLSASLGPQRVNSNLADLSEGPLCTAKPHAFTNKQCAKLTFFVAGPTNLKYISLTRLLVFRNDSIT